MKLFLTGICFVGFFLGHVFADIDEQVVAYSKDCITETGVSNDLVVKLREHDLSHDDPKLKVCISWGNSLKLRRIIKDLKLNFQCFVKCMCRKADLCDEFMNLNVAKVEDHVPVEKRHMMDDAIGACSPTEGTDECDTIYKKLKCFYEHIHK